MDLNFKTIFCDTWSRACPRTSNLEANNPPVRRKKLSDRSKNLTKSFWVFFSVKLFYKINRKRFSCFCIAWYKHERGWANSRQLCKPETNVENSPNPFRVYIRLCKHRKNVFYCFYKIALSPQKVKNSLLWHWLKQKLLPVPKVL